MLKLSVFSCPFHGFGRRSRVEGRIDCTAIERLLRSLQQQIEPPYPKQVEESFEKSVSDLLEYAFFRLDHIGVDAFFPSRSSYSAVWSVPAASRFCLLEFKLIRWLNVTELNFILLLRRDPVLKLFLGANLTYLITVFSCPVSAVNIRTYALFSTVCLFEILILVLFLKHSTRLNRILFWIRLFSHTTDLVVDTSATQPLLLASKKVQ